MAGRVATYAGADPQGAVKLTVGFINLSAILLLQLRDSMAGTFRRSFGCCANHAYPNGVNVIQIPRSWEAEGGAYVTPSHEHLAKCLQQAQSLAWLGLYKTFQTRQGSHMDRLAASARTTCFRTTEGVGWQTRQPVSVDVPFGRVFLWHIDGGAWNPVRVRDGCATVSSMLVVG